MKIHRQYCQDRAAEIQTYAQGFWGINASDGPAGYAPYGAIDGPDDGTVSPTGAIAAITFEPEETVAEQLAQLSKMTGRPIDELVNDLLRGPLNQIVQWGDTDYMLVVLD